MNKQTKSLNFLFQSALVLLFFVPAILGASPKLPEIKLEVECILPSGKKVNGFTEEGLLRLGFVDGTVECILREAETKDRGIDSKKNPDQIRYLVFLWSHLDTIEVCDWNGKVCQKSGYTIPQKDKDIPAPFPSFSVGRFPLQIKIQSKNYIAPEILLLDDSDFLRFLTKYTGIILSVSFLFGAYCLTILVLWAIYRQTWLAVFGFFLLGWFSAILVLSGFFHLFVIPDYSFSLATTKKLTVGYLEITGILWILTYFELPSKAPWWGRFYYFLLACVSLCLLALNFPISRFLLSLSFHSIYLIATLVAIYLALHRISDSLRPSPWLLGSLLSLLLWEILNIFAYDHLDLHDSQIFLVLILVSFIFQIYSSLRTVKEIEEEKIPFKKTHLKGLNVQELTDKLNTLMSEEKIYLEEELRLADLAAIMGVSVHQLSEFLNQYLGYSFSDMIKRYRVEEAKLKMEQEPRKNLLNIAYESGFISKSVFNDAFRKWTNMSPQEYRKYLLQKDFQE